jgi:pimeloyl-ACP methyl ester carboxylesterase
MKTILFIPGFPETINSRNYGSAIKALESKGYKVKFVQIDWARKTITDWVAEFETVYIQHDPSETILAGFSYGAMTAFIAASHQNPAALWLFSLSPYFADDLPKLKQWWLKEIGKKRVDSFKKLDFPPLARKIACPTLIFYGEKEGIEWPWVKERAEEAHRFIKNSQLFEVPGADHDVADPRYIEVIKENI